jgi:hypothetical protein
MTPMRPDAPPFRDHFAGVTVPARQEQEDKQIPPPFEAKQGAPKDLYRE